MVSKLQFLGTGGGRINMILQMRATAGIYAEFKGARIYVDPGPGALVRARMQRINLEKLDAVLVSHCHIDHSNDAGALVEAMTRGTREKRGVLAGSVSALDWPDKPVSLYHQNCVGERVVLKADEEFAVGGVGIRTTPTKHTDETGVGFIFDAEETVSYLSDTNYTKKIAGKHRGSRIIILNCLYLKWDESKADGCSQKHMDVEDTKKFVRDINPEVAIIQHFGMGIIKHGPWKVAQEIQEETGVKTVAARDNQVFEIGGRKGSLCAWVKNSAK
ncbi:MAG: MBL fold metallo-hydrolase [archaeon]|nr:MBL fold metallo-hydrolase [archaeon]